MIEGLYVSIRPDGTIKKRLSTKDGEAAFPERTIPEEMITFSEQDYIFLAMYRKELCCYAGGDVTDTEVIAAVAQVAERIKNRNILCGTLAYLEFWDMFHCWVPDGLEHRVEATLHFGTAFDAWSDVSTALAQVSEGKQVDCCELSTTYIAVTQYGKPAEYVFRSEAQYYYFLLQHLLESETRICKCQFCGGYFAPKTKHRTLYCDRVIRNGKTCRQIAPYLKRRELSAVHRVISEFNRIKDMQRHRYERTLDSKRESSIDMDFEAYNQWLSAATTARDRYLAGELSEKEALDIIYVPTKRELVENNSSEVTLANSRTPS